MSKTHIHKSVTERMVMDAMVRRNTTLDNPGICITCGNEQDDCEPDAQEYTCDACGERTVYGIDEIFIQGLYRE